MHRFGLRHAGEAHRPLPAGVAAASGRGADSPSGHCWRRRRGRRTRLGHPPGAAAHPLRADRIRAAASGRLCRRPAPPGDGVPTSSGGGRDGRRRGVLGRSRRGVAGRWPRRGGGSRALGDRRRGAQVARRGGARHRRPWLHRRQSRLAKHVAWADLRRRRRGQHGRRASPQVRRLRRAPRSDPCRQSASFRHWRTPAAVSSAAQRLGNHRPRRPAGARLPRPLARWRPMGLALEAVARSTLHAPLQRLAGHGRRTAHAAASAAPGSAAGHALRRLRRQDRRGHPAAGARPPRRRRLRDDAARHWRRRGGDSSGGGSAGGELRRLPRHDRRQLPLRPRQRPPRLERHLRDGCQAVLRPGLGDGAVNGAGDDGRGLVPDDGRSAGGLPCPWRGPGRRPLGGSRGAGHRLHGLRPAARRTLRQGWAFPGRKTPAHQAHRHRRPAGRRDAGQHPRQRPAGRHRHDGHLQRPGRSGAASVRRPRLHRRHRLRPRWTLGGNDPRVRRRRRSVPRPDTELERRTGTDGGERRQFLAGQQRTGVGRL